MIKFILILFLVDRATLVATPTVPTFDDKPACEAALAAISDIWRGPPDGPAATAHASVGVCVAQSTPQPPVVTPPVQP